MSPLVVPTCGVKYLRSPPSLRICTHQAHIGYTAHYQSASICRELRPSHFAMHALLLASSRQGFTDRVPSEQLLELVICMLYGRCPLTRCLAGIRSSRGPHISTLQPVTVVSGYSVTLTALSFYVLLPLCTVSSPSVFPFLLSSPPARVSVR